jgi:hypothetical protein
LWSHRRWKHKREVWFYWTTYVSEIVYLSHYKWVDLFQKCINYVFFHHINLSKSSVFGLGYELS